jgi:alpha-amylase
VTEFKFAAEIGRVFHGRNSLKWLRNFGPQWSLLPSNLALTFVDNHDNQRGHGAGSDNILTYKNAKAYKMASAFHLAWNYGISKVMSSYAFENADQGPPNVEGNIISPKFNANGACIEPWICEHRWRQIYNMVKFKSVVENASVGNFWDNGNNQIAFSRGNRGFIAFNLENHDLNARLKTGLSAGVYCDVGSGDKINNKCTGKSVTVGNDGFAWINVKHNEFDGFLAIHIDAKL